jgi:hypothetical protein
MKSVLEWIRRFARFVLAMALWLNALFLLRLAPPRLSPLASRLHLNLGETTILVLIVSFSVLMSYGIKNLVVDALYIYFFPFVLMFLLAQSGYRFFRVFIWKKTARRTDQIVQQNAVEPQQQAVPVVSPPAKQSIWERIRRDILRPFFQFTLLWALLLLYSSHRWLLWTALVIVLVHLVRALFRVSVLAVFSIKGLAQLEVRIKTWAQLQIAKAIAASRQADESQDVRKAWGAIAALQLGVKLFQNRQAVAQSIIFLSILVFGAIYLYIALLFSFAYYGLARIANIPYSWADAFVTSVFIPFQFSDLPHSIYIKILAGIHCVFVLAIGAGTVFGYLQKKVNSLYSVADFLSDKFQQEDLRTSVEVLTQRFAPKKAADSK